METKTKHPHLRFALWFTVAAVLLTGVLCGIYWIAYRSYPVVAEWVDADSHEAFVMDGEVWRRVGTLGKNNLNASDYPTQDTVGRVDDDGAVTRAPADGTPDISRHHAYLLYSVQKKADALLMLEPDGSYSVYWRDLAAWLGDDGVEAFVYQGKTYRHLGSVLNYGSSYSADAVLGFVSRSASAQHDAALMYSVKTYSYLLVVDGTDGQQHLYCREGEKPPFSLVEKN